MRYQSASSPIDIAENVFVEDAFCRRLGKTSVKAALSRDRRKDRIALGDYLRLICPSG
jgi:hypothetical protein